ncbi:hypothetical protein K443DRAFT_124691 [Laccaria amethystina LaAM-08-1]|uniref:Unplaced genomic scaffold K443scaffold_207, whole genome shotgun sequence n=1 Tax=Laccaria amethystina LaAM-08-1 TaxID=1095629 RepID=A0A0C9WK44_9AGAR|nr:hypothetical protein K443DRAFT_124691 [Laccaria amethystina LaAM-08-1]
MVQPLILEQDILCETQVSGIDLRYNKRADAFLQYDSSFSSIEKQKYDESSSEINGLNFSRLLNVNGDECGLLVRSEETWIISPQANNLSGDRPGHIAAFISSPFAAHFWTGTKLITSSSGYRNGTALSLTIPCGINIQSHPSFA